MKDAFALWVDGELVSQSFSHQSGFTWRGRGGSPADKSAL